MTLKTTQQVMNVLDGGIGSDSSLPVRARNLGLIPKTGIWIPHTADSGSPEIIQLGMTAELWNVQGLSESAATDQKVIVNCEAEILLVTVLGTIASGKRIWITLNNPSSNNPPRIILGPGYNEPIPFYCGENCTGSTPGVMYFNWDADLTGGTNDAFVCINAGEYSSVVPR